MKFIIIHGTKGSPESNWFPWLKSELRALDHEVIVPQFPTPVGQSLDSWWQHFEKYVGQLDDNTVLVGHSIGAVFVLRVLEQVQAKIAAAALVAPFIGALGLTEYDQLNSSFVAAPFNWSEICQRAEQFLVYFGEEDPYVPQNQSLCVAENLSVIPSIIQGGGHLNSEFGFTTFSALLNDLLKLPSQ